MAAPPGALDQSAEILVRPNGSLLALFARFQIEGAGAVQKLFVSRSRDQGRTWSTPVQVTSQPIGFIPDPETGDALSNQDLTFHSAAIAPDGTVYVAWDRDSSATSGTIDIAKSRDGGATWSGPTPLPGRSRSLMEPDPRRRTVRHPHRAAALRRPADRRVPGAGGPAHARLRGGLHPSGAAGEGRSHRHLLRAHRTPSLQARARLLPLAGEAAELEATRKRRSSPDQRSRGDRI